MITAQTTMGLCLRFSGLVKTTIKKYLMKYLSSLELTEEGRGQRKVVIEKSLNASWIITLVWVGRDSYYFISVVSSKRGKPYSQQQWRQSDQDLNN